MSPIPLVKTKPTLKENIMLDTNLRTRIITFLEDYTQELIKNGVVSEIAAISPSLVFFNIETRQFDDDKDVSVLSFDAFPEVYASLEFDDWDDVTKGIQDELEIDWPYMILMIAEFEDIGDGILCVYFDTTHQKLQGMVLDLECKYQYNFDPKEMTPWIQYRLDEAVHV